MVVGRLRWSPISKGGFKVIRIDFDSRTMHWPTVVGVIRATAVDAPVRVSCSCGSRVWVGPKSSRWLPENFVENHHLHGEIVIESAQEGDNCESGQETIPLVN